MRLPPLLAPRIPELDRRQARPRHLKVRDVENIACLAININGSVAEAENLEGLEFAAVHKRC